jgi:hypothetical protein
MRGTGDINSCVVRKRLGLRNEEMEYGRESDGVGGVVDLVERMGRKKKGENLARTYRRALHPRFSCPSYVPDGLTMIARGFHIDNFWAAASHRSRILRALGLRQLRGLMVLKYSSW